MCDLAIQGDSLASFISAKQIFDVHRSQLAGLELAQAQDDVLIDRAPLGGERTSAELARTLPVLAPLDPLIADPAHGGCAVEEHGVAAGDVVLDPALERVGLFFSRKGFDLCLPASR